MAAQTNLPSFFIRALKCAFFLIYCFFLFSSESSAFSISSVNKSEISSPEDIVEVTLDLSDLPSRASYFRVAFTESNTHPSYFGKMENDRNEWVEIGSLSNCTNYYKLGDPTVTGQIIIKVKMNGEEKPGEYYLRAHRLTEGCSATDNTEFVSVVYSQFSSNPSSTPSPTPASKNYPSNISLSEFSACSSPEWVEIYNANDSQVQLDNWFIRDSTDSKKQEFSCNIGAKSFYKIEMNSFLNNSGGDTVRLFNPEAEVDSYSYTTCDSEHSWSRLGGSWCQTNQTPGSGNSSCLVGEEGEDSNGEDDSEDSEDDKDSANSPSPVSQVSGNLIAKASVKSNSVKQSSLLPSLPLPVLGTLSGEILGATESATPSAEPEENKPPPFLIPLVISGLGLLLIGGAAFPFLKPKVLKIIRKRGN